MPPTITLWGIVDLGGVDMILTKGHTASWSIHQVFDWHQIWRAFIWQAFIFHIDRLDSRAIRQNWRRNPNFWGYGPRPYPTLFQARFWHSWQLVTPNLIYVLSRLSCTLFLVCWMMHHSLRLHHDIKLTPPYI